MVWNLISRPLTFMALGVDDKTRAAKAVKGVAGKRLMYRPADQAAHE